MGHIQHQPTSPGRRFQSTVQYDDVTETKPVKSLVSTWKRSGGRNNTGRITSRHRGGGAKRTFRIIDFKRDKRGIPGVVAAIAYDPNRSANLALINYVDGEKRYILQAVGVGVGSPIMAAEDAEIKPGNALPLRRVPVGTSIHNIEMKVGRGGQICRTAGSQAQLMAKDGDYAQIRLPSSEVRKIHLDCWATIGQVGNVEYENISVGKAGRSRHYGIRPQTRGMAMNPVDHPHGGGEGRSKGGNHPVSPTGIPSKGYKTRRNKSTGKFIVRRRGQK